MPSIRQSARLLAILLAGGSAWAILAHYLSKPRGAPAAIPTAMSTNRTSISSPLAGEPNAPIWTSQPSVYLATLKEVIDGNTLAVMGDDDRELVVRLAYIDAPSLQQPYGEQARSELRALTQDNPLQIISLGVTPDGKALVRILVDGLDISGALVRAGAARVAAEPSLPDGIIGLENEARDNKRGLWALPARDRMRPCWWRGDC